jgi:hypothetical protein
MTKTRAATALAAALAAVAVSAPSSPAATTKLYAFLDGAAETGPGDPDGHARIALTFDRARRRVCFDLRKFRIETPTAAHIHRGVKGKDGPDVIALFTRPTGAGRGRVTGCATNVSRAAMDAVTARPARYYVNVLTAAYPEGSVRGQLTRRKLV